MTLYILEDSANLFFEKASMLENADPSGVWRHFDFKNKKQTIGLFEASKTLDNNLESVSTPHEDFFSYFLGQFSPDIKKNINIQSYDSFYDFCLSLNTLLSSNVKIYDLSVKNKWIWHEGTEIQIPKKLHDYIN